MALHLTKLQRTELASIVTDKTYFQTHYLKLTNRQGELVRMSRLPAQDIVHAEGVEHRYRTYLKSRRLGCSAQIAADNFHAAMFSQLACIVVSHRRSSAQEIYEQYYKGFYEHLPQWLKDLFPTVKSNVRELKFRAGGRIVVTTSESEEARSGGYQRYHLSEAAQYRNLETTLAAILTSAPISAQIVIETTANGPNEFFDFWHARGEWEMSRRYHRTFMGWTTDPSAVGERIGEGRYRVFAGPDEETGEPVWETVDFNERPMSFEEIAYQLDHKLPMERMAWVRMALGVLCGGNWNTFNQEFPATADLAFILGGKPYFSKRFIDVAAGENLPGLNIIEAPKRFRTYVLGSDPGPGAKGGAWSTAVVLDVSHENRVRTVATLGTESVGAINFAERLFALGMRYEALVNVERNNVGTTVIEQLLRMRYPWLCQSERFDRVTGRHEDVIGYDTEEHSRIVALSRMQKFLYENWLSLDGADRIKREINTFVYNDKGKPEKAKGQRDDLVMGTAMALMALDRISYTRTQRQMGRRPTSVHELVEWELATGRIYEPGMSFGDDDDPVRRAMGGGPGIENITDLLTGR